MAGSAKSYNTALVELGPGDIWINVAVPGAGARVVLDAATGTPDATANPSTKHLGMTEGGAKIIYTPNVTTFESDEQTAPIISQNVSENARLEGSSLQILDTALMTFLMVGATYGTAAGYEQNTFGGKQTVPTFTVLYIAPVYADPTKFLVFNLYKAYNASGWSADLTRKKMAAVPFSFVGLSISSRAAGDQAGNLYKTI